MAGVFLKRSWGGEVQNILVLVVVGVNEEGFREILGVAEGSRENKDAWSNFLRYLKERGLKGVRLACGSVVCQNQMCAKYRTLPVETVLH